MSEARVPSTRISWSHRPRCPSSPLERLPSHGYLTWEFTA